MVRCRQTRLKNAGTVPVFYSECIAQCEQLNACRFAGYWPCPRLAPRRLTGSACGVWRQYRWLTRTGIEVPPSGLKPNSRISEGDLLPSLF